MPKVHSIFVRVTALLLLLLAISFAADPRQVSVYAPQTNYQVDILVRDGVDYVGVTDLLEPLGRLESRVQGNKLTLIFNGATSDFQDGKRQYRTAANPRLELAANFLLVDGRGYIPVASITQLLARAAGLTCGVPRRTTPPVRGLRRSFIFPPNCVTTPPASCSAFLFRSTPPLRSRKDRVRLIFRREPVVGSGADTVSYNDPFLLGTSFAEIPGGAEFIANVRQPATVSIGDGGRTVTIAAQTVRSLPRAIVFSSSPIPGHPAPPPQRSRPFVILDASHGGSETGAVLSPTLLEKTVNLALARRLQKELESRGIPVVLTRVADNLLTWDQRAISANTSHASLYVALHSSASGHGVRIYTSLVAPPQPSRTNAVFCPGSWRSRPTWTSPRQLPQPWRRNAARMGLPVRISAAPLRPLNSVTLAAVAVELAPLGTLPANSARAQYQQKIAESLATAIAALRSKLEAAQ